jgi:hypothetical protein
MCIRRKSSNREIGFTKMAEPETSCSTDLHYYLTGRLTASDCKPSLSMVDCLEGCKRKDAGPFTTDVSALSILLSHELMRKIVERKDGLDPAFNSMEQIDNQ